MHFIGLELCSQWSTFFRSDIITRWLILCIALDSIGWMYLSLKMNKKGFIFASTCTAILLIIGNIVIFIMKPISSSGCFFLKSTVTLIILIIILAGRDIAGLVLMLDLCLLELIGVSVFIVVVLFGHHLYLLTVAW